MKALLCLLMLVPFAMAEKMMLDENYELVPYQDWSKRADLPEQRVGEFITDINMVGENEVQTFIGFRMFGLRNPIKAMKEHWGELAAVDFEPDLDVAVAQADEGVADVDYAGRVTASEIRDVKQVIEDTEPKGATGVVADGVKNNKGKIALGLISAAGGYWAYKERKDDGDSESQPDSGVRVRDGDVFVSDTTAEGREISVSISGDRTELDVTTFDSSPDEVE